MTVQRESEGPDRTWGGVRCREFHDLPDQDLGGDPNCCCCNPCETLRMGAVLMDSSKWSWCCKCVPRVIFLLFTPNDEEDLCCRVTSIPLFASTTDPTLVAYVEYLGHLYGYTVSVSLGTFGANVGGGGHETGTGTEVYSCHWRVRVWETVTSIKVFDETYEILGDEASTGTGTGTDTDTGTGTGTGGYQASCTSPPLGLLVKNVIDPMTCEGSLSLFLEPKSRLPYIERSLPVKFNSVRDPRDNTGCQGDGGTGTGTGTGDYEFGGAIDACQPMHINFCGECDPDYTTLTQILVNSTAYNLDVAENGKSTFTNDDRVVYWDGSQWLLALRPSTPSEEQLLATGPPLPDCPLGSYEWQDGGTGTGTGTGTEEQGCFCVSKPGDTTTQPLCWCCGQVCSRISVSGPRTLASDYDARVTFTWFEDKLAGSVIGRGWKYKNKITGHYERILLGDSNQISVNGDTWNRDYRSHGFGEADYPYWRYWDGVAEYYLYWSGAQWVIMVAGNPESYGSSDPSTPYGSYTGVTYNFTVGAPDGGTCIMQFYIEEDPDNDIFPNVVVDTPGCSCGLHLVSHNVSEQRAITVRCGVHSCWDFLCGTCRCVPTELCVNVYYNGNWHPNMTLTWDEDIKGWSGEQEGIVGVGTGTGAGEVLELVILLQNDGGEGSEGRCILVPEVGDWEAGDDTIYPEYECGKEVILSQYDPDVEVLKIDFEDHSQPNNPLIIVGSSLKPVCYFGACSDATVCQQECGSHPEILYATIRQWNAEIAEYDHTVVVKLIYWEVIDFFHADSNEVVFACGYRGVIPATSAPTGTGTDTGDTGTGTGDTGGDPVDCDPVMVSLTGGSIEGLGGIIDIEETCDPYYGESPDDLNDFIFYLTCYGYDDSDNIKVIITE